MINNKTTQFHPHESNSVIDTSINLTGNYKQSINKFFSLKTKATLLAIAIGVIPVATVGYLAHIILSRSLAEQISSEQLEKTQIAANSVTRFLEDRLQEIDAISKSAILTDAKLRDAMTLQEKTEVLDNFKDELKYYNSLVFFDPQGDPIFQAKSDSPNLKNYADKAYFQEAIKTDAITINGPGISASSGQLRVEFAAPVKDKETGELIGILRFKIPGNYISGLFDIYERQNKNWNLINEQGKIFAGDRQSFLNQSVAEHYSEVESLHQVKKDGVVISQVNSDLESSDSDSSAPNNASSEVYSTQTQLVSYVAAQPPERFPNTNIGVLMAMDEDIAFAAIESLDLALLLGSAAAALLVAAIAAYIANRATIPLIEAVSALQKIGRGELNTRLNVNRQDELGELGSNINFMTEHIQTLLEEQKNLAEQQRQEKEQLELAIYTLIEEIGEATDGDLTVRANLDNLELSTVADLFNAIIDNLQEIAIEARQSSNLVGSSLQQNEEAILMLAQQASAEAKETRDTLKSVAKMSQSIQTVAANASEVEKIADDTYSTVLSSTKNMDSTVDSILNLRTTVSDTANKMQRLTESSQKISQAVSLIEEIALKTNVLAINAGAEADRAGEYGQGFSVVAEQVGALAEQSKAAIKEIANIVSGIQAETEDVRQAMESGTAQVLNTTRLVENTKQSLAEVLEKSQTINQLMESISQSTVSQADTSQSVTSLMQRIAQLSASTSKSSAEVAQSMGETARVAEKLKSAVSQFKVTK